MQLEKWDRRTDMCFWLQEQKRSNHQIQTLCRSKAVEEVLRLIVLHLLKAFLT